MKKWIALICVLMMAFGSVAAAETAPKAKVRLPQAYQDAKKQLAGKFQTVVKIQRDAQGKGHLTFSFKSDEELDRLLSLLQKSGN